MLLTIQDVSQLIIAREDIAAQMQQARVTMELSEAQLNQVLTARDAVSGVRINQLKESLSHAQAAYMVAEEKNALFNPGTYARRSLGEAAGCRKRNQRKSS